MNSRSDFTHSPLLAGGPGGGSVLVGMPQGFDLLRALRRAERVRLAIAFGHMSGWRHVESALLESQAASVDVLLGQAFFHTEPELLYKLLNLSSMSKGPKFCAKLASVDATFHPKVWIIKGHEYSEAIVGSGNLSKGGLADNVECGMYTRDTETIAALEQWLDSHWAIGSPLESSHELYIAKYRELEQFRKQFQSKMLTARNEILDREASWRRKEALRRAIGYWDSEEGRADVEARSSAVSRMRSILKYPDYDFSSDGWEAFLRVLEFGRVRIAHAEKTIAHLDPLKVVLRKMTGPGLAVGEAIDELIAIPGIGRNLATKLLVLNDPNSNVAFNEPVERALLAFGYKAGEHKFSGEVYLRLVSELKPFIEESDAMGLECAAALDAFFYAYASDQGFSADNDPSGRTTAPDSRNRLPAFLALVDEKWLAQALKELGEGRTEIFLGTSSPGASPAFGVRPDKIYFKVKGRPEVIARGKFIGITKQNPRTQRLRGSENDDHWNFYYGFRNVTELDQPIPMHSLRYISGKPVPVDLMGSWVISDPEGPPEESPLAVDEPIEMIQPL